MAKVSIVNQPAEAVKKNYSDLNWMDGVASIQLDDLQRSAQIADMGHEYNKNRPMAEYEFVEKVHRVWQDLAPNNMIETEILVYSDHTKKVMAKGLDINEVSIENLSFSKMIGRLTCPSHEIDGIMPELAFLIHESGIAISYGEHVRICSNFTLMGGKLYQTYGANKVSFADMMQLLSMYLVNWERQHERMLSTISQMKSIIVEPAMLDQFVGRLMTQAVLDRDSPLNMSQGHEAIRKLAAEVPAVDGTVWDVTNALTSTVHFRNVGPQHSLHSNGKALDLIANHWKIPAYELLN